MILLALLGCFVALSYLLGGRFEVLAQVQLRFSHLVPIALLIQVVIFSAWWQAHVGRVLSEGLYVSSLVLLGLATWLNRRVPGIALVGLGLLLNGMVILANGGHMPASLQALQRAGIVDSQATFERMRATNSSLIGDNTPLWFLGDIFAVPHNLPLANVFSVGDVLIGLGAAHFVVANMRRRRVRTRLVGYY